MSETPQRFSKIGALETLGQELERLNEASEPRASLLGRRSFRIVALSAAGAVALVTIALLRTSDDTGESGTADSFSSLAAVAAEQPAGLEHVIWSSELRYSVSGKGGGGSGLKSAVQVELWGDRNIRFQDSVNDLDGDGISRFHASSLIDRNYGAFCFSEERTNPRRTIAEPAACARLDGVVDPAGLAALLPTDPARLKVALQGFDADFRDLNLEYLEGIGDAGGKPSAERCSLRGLFGSSVPPSTASDRSTLLGDLDALPAHVTQSAGGGYTYTYPPIEDLFSAAIVFLADPSASPELRAGIFEVLADLPNTELTAGAVDQLGRPATVVEYQVPKGDATFKRSALDEIYLDPETSEVLELRTSVFDPARDGEVPKVVGTYDRVFTEREQVDALPSQAQPLEDALVTAKRTCGPAA